MNYARGAITQGCEIFILTGNLINKLENERFTYEHNIESFVELIKNFNILKICRYVFDYLV